MSVSKRNLLLIGIALIVWLPTVFGPDTAVAADIRAAAQRAAADLEAARLDAEATRDKISSDRESLIAEVERLEALQADLEVEVAALGGRIDESEAERLVLEEAWSRRELDFREISGNVRTAARDLENLLRHSMTSAIVPGRVKCVERLLGEGYFPDIDDISALANVYFDEIVRSGEVVIEPALEFVNRSGIAENAEVLRLGRFTAIYQTDEEIGYLVYKPEEGRLFAHETVPNWRIRRNLSRYLAGESETVMLDITHGAALRQIRRGAGLWEQLRSGGPIVWPILLIALLAAVIVFERILFLNRVHGNTDTLMGTVNDLAARHEWDECEKLVNQPEHKASPVVNVITAGLAGRHENRETLESILQEAILKELPRLEHFLTALAVFGAIAPLLGLLGTVTGMIDTFRVITLHGTGDPRLMSGGISEALITTELGLIVAIPIMLLHTYLSRRVNHIIGDMEEKAVALTNIIRKGHRGDGSAAK